MTNVDMQRLAQLAEAVPENLGWTTSRTLHKSIPVGQIAKAFVALSSGRSYSYPKEPYEVEDNGMWVWPPRWQRAHMMKRAMKFRERKQKRKNMTQVNP